MVTALGAIAGVVAPIAGSTLPLPVFATAARTGARFDHVVIEEFAGKIDEGDHLVAILDPVSPASSGAVDLLDALAADAALPPVVGVVQGDNAAMVAFLFEQAPAFDAMGHAPRDALRRFYRRLPVVLALHDGVIAGAWHESVPSAADVSAAYGKIQER